MMDITKFPIDVGIGQPELIVGFCEGCSVPCFAEEVIKSHTRTKVLRGKKKKVFVIDECKYCKKLLSRDEL